MRELANYSESMGQFAHWFVEYPKRAGESGFGQSRVASSPSILSAWFRSCGARPGRSGRAFAFSSLPDNPRSAAVHEGVNQTGLPDRYAALLAAWDARCNTSPAAATGCFKSPHEGRPKDGCRADKLSLGTVVIPPIWTRTHTSRPTIHRALEQKQLDGPITRRSSVQFRQALPTSEPSSTRQSARFGSEWLLVQLQRFRPSTGGRRWLFT